MDPNVQKEQFSDAFLHAIAAVSECACCKPSVDDDSVDWTISKVIHGRPKLDVQLKCTAEAPTEVSLPFDLKKKNYDDLRITNVLVPRLLVVVIVPAMVETWLLCEDHQLVLRYRAVWYSLRGLPDSDNTTSVRLQIPADQRLTVESLNSIMQTIAGGGAI
jgi:hypothetical protein